ncbi:molybdenum cofactor guanylyltransferase [Arenimonas sp.]|uniref:molybdenum cofactor guanylyltransferase n=1 Tax=Arenimonas sp. TaxID=1872635 RepID=UPI0035B393AA
MIPPGAVTLGLLAGGRGERFGGRDKAWIEHHGRPLIAHANDALQAPFAARLASVREDDERLAALGLLPVHDLRPDFAGPVAGLEALAWACPTPWLLTLPVDLSGMPADLPARLWAKRGEHGAGTRDVHGPQPLLALWHAPALATAASAALEAGQGAAWRLAETLRLPALDLSPRVLANFNTPESLLQDAGP